MKIAEVEFLGTLTATPTVIQGMSHNHTYAPRSTEPSLQPAAVANTQHKPHSLSEYLAAS